MILSRTKTISIPFGAGLYSAIRVMCIIHVYRVRTKARARNIISGYTDADATVTAMRSHSSRDWSINSIHLCSQCLRVYTINACTENNNNNNEKLCTRCSLCTDQRFSPKQRRNIGLCVQRKKQFTSRKLIFPLHLLHIVLHNKSMLKHFRRIFTMCPIGWCVSALTFHCSYSDQTEWSGKECVYAVPFAFSGFLSAFDSVCVVCVLDVWLKNVGTKRNIPSGTYETPESRENKRIRFSTFTTSNIG